MKKTRILIKFLAFACIWLFVPHKIHLVYSIQLPFNRPCTHHSGAHMVSAGFTTICFAINGATKRRKNRTKLNEQKGSMAFDFWFNFLARCIYSLVNVKRILTSSQCQYVRFRTHQVCVKCSFSPHKNYVQ